MKKFLVAVVALALCFGVSQTVSAKTSAPTKVVFFSVGQSKLSASAKSTLAALAKTLKSSDTVEVRGYVQKASSPTNDLSLSTQRASTVKAYLIALGVKAKISAMGYGLPKSNRSSAQSRRADINVVHSAPKPTSSPSPSPSQSVAPAGFISGTIERTYPYNSCADITLDYVKLYQGSTLIASIDSPAWSSTSGNVCDYAYSFQGIPDGTYSVEESFTQSSRCPWDVSNVAQPTWTFVGTFDREAVNQVHRIDNLVVAGGVGLSSIDMRMYNSD